jgi:hypothetical protein
MRLNMEASLELWQAVRRGAANRFLFDAGLAEHILAERVDVIAARVGSWKALAQSDWSFGALTRQQIQDLIPAG